MFSDLLPNFIKGGGDLGECLFSAGLGCLAYSFNRSVVEVGFLQLLDSVRVIVDTLKAAVKTLGKEGGYIGKLISYGFR